jgi:glycosyltransferase involved in cell wall biosynthesis
VVLLAHPHSKTNATLAPWPRARSQDPVDAILNTLHLHRVYFQKGPFDLIHSFARLIYLLPLLPFHIPKIQSYQRHVTARSVRFGSRIGNALAFTACSEFLMQSSRLGSENWSAIPNGVRLEKYAFRETVASNAPLLFLGRLERIKGAHHAIAVAKKTGRRLILAGNRSDRGPEAKYFEQEIAPHLDSNQIEYLGPVDDVQKSELLGKAAALLFPIEWDEPFGIVMVEALACGTPVLAVKRGSVPEIVTHGVTGWLVDQPSQLEQGVGQISNLDRKQCRESVERKFSSAVIAQQYLDLYRKMTD